MPFLVSFSCYLKNRLSCGIIEKNISGRGYGYDRERTEKAAKEFAERWKGRGYEKGESNLFWIDLLTHVYGVDNIAEFISFEDQVHLDHTSFIDGYIKSTHVMIEQKSIGKDLRKAIKQSDGSLLNTF